MTKAKRVRQQKTTSGLWAHFWGITVDDPNIKKDCRLQVATERSLEFTAPLELDPSTNKCPVDPFCRYPSLLIPVYYEHLSRGEE